MSLKSKWKLWEEFLSSSLTFRLLRVWFFIYCPVVIKSPALVFEINGKERSNGAFLLPKKIALNHVCIYHRIVYGDNIVSKFKFVGFFSPQHHTIFSSSITCEMMSQIRTKECNTKSFIFKVNINFLRSSRNFNSHTAFASIESFLI